MAKIYLRKIKAGDMTLADVPERWQAAAEALVLAFIATPEGQAWLQDHPGWRGEGGQ